jgi:hypothetical protein
MSMTAMAIGATSQFVAQVSDPTADAPAGLKAKTDLVLGLVKWGSLIAVLGLLLASGMIALAGDRGYGGGMSPELKSSVMKGVIALVIVGSAAQIVTFVA